MTLPDEEITVPLSTSVIFGGITSHNRDWRPWLQSLMQRIGRCRVDLDSDFRVNVEFHVPGNLLSPDYEGVRTGAFRKRDSVLKVQAALARETPPDAWKALIATMWQALDAADEWIIRRKRSANTAVQRRILAAVEAEGPPQLT